MFFVLSDVTEMIQDDTLPDNLINQSSEKIDF